MYIEIENLFSASNEELVKRLQKYADKLKK